MNSKDIHVILQKTIIRSESAITKFFHKAMCCLGHDPADSQYDKLAKIPKRTKSLLKATKKFFVYAF